MNIKGILLGDGGDPFGLYLLLLERVYVKFCICSLISALPALLVLLFVLFAVV